jgi:hypothetical protein
MGLSSRRHGETQKGTRHHALRGASQAGGSKGQHTLTMKPIGIGAIRGQ